MFLRFFQSQHPIGVIILVILAFAYWSFALFGAASPLPQEGAILYQWLIGLMGNWPKTWMVVSIFAAVLLALYWNFILEKHRLLGRRNYLPAVMFVLFFCSNTQLTQSLPILFGTLFLIPALDRILTFSRQGPASAAAFDTGLLLALGSLFYGPVVVFFPLILIALANLRSFIWREWVLAFLGFFIPYLFAGVWLYWTDRLGSFGVQIQLLSNFHLPDWHRPSASLIGYLAVIAWVLFAGWGAYSQSIFTNTVRVKRSLILFVWLTFVLLLTWPAYGKTPTAMFGLLAFPLSIYLGTYFTFSKNRWLRELLFVLLIMVNFLYQFQFHT